MKKLFVSLLALCSSTIAINAQQVTFRGLNHCGLYPNEKNLMKQWPEGGPEKLWVVNDAGKGNSSALVSDGFSILLVSQRTNRANKSHATSSTAQRSIK